MAEVRALDAATIVGLLADDDRRRVFAALELGATTLDEAAHVAGVPSARAAKAAGRLAEAGLVVQLDGELHVLGAAFQVAAREALARPASAEHVDQPREARRVLDAFVRDATARSVSYAPRSTGSDSTRYASLTAAISPAATSPARSGWLRRAATRYAVRSWTGVASGATPSRS